jgi:general nucleoside transport system permease protein
MKIDNDSKNGTSTKLVEIKKMKQYRIIGILIFIIGISSLVTFFPSIETSQLSTFGLNLGGNDAIKIPNLVLPTGSAIFLLSTICAILGGYQLTKGFGKRTNLILGLTILMFIFEFLIWATRGKSINLTGMLRLTVIQATPLVLGALSGILSERSGIVNIAIEGLMLVSALASLMVSSITQNLYLGLAAGIACGAFFALVHGILSIKYQVDQIISGMVINIFAAGITSFIGIKFLVHFPELNQSKLFPNIAIPGLSSIPILGPIFFNQSMFTYITIILLFLIHFSLFNTKWGLRTRMVGEHPKAAETLGINVYRTRYVAVILSGMVAGLAGSYLTLGAVGRFNRLMTSGRGFIALAAMIFGNWKPFGALGASLIFGFTSSLESKLSILQVGIPSQILLMAPYLVTMIVLVGVVGKVTPPAADGQTYTGKE